MVVPYFLIFCPSGAGLHTCPLLDFLPATGRKQSGTSQQQENPCGSHKQTDSSRVSSLQRKLKRLQAEKKRLKAKSLAQPPRTHELIQQLKREIARLSKCDPTVLDSESESENSNNE